MFKLYRWQRIIALIITFAMTAATIAIATPLVYGQTPPKLPRTELRGVWLTNIDSEVLYSKKNVTTAIDRLAQLNFNTVYPTVWQGGYTLYPSAIAKGAMGIAMEPTPGLKGRDVLKEIVDEAHKKGLAVIPWFEFGFMAPADSELAKKHPDWLTKRRDGTTIWKEGKDDRVWLNPFHPQVQKFILDLIIEIVVKYNIDGIQFDDHFGLPAEFGYDNLTVAMYKKEVNGQSPSDDFRETFWGRWRADKINGFMGRIFRAVKFRKPKCIMSLSPNPLHFALPAHLQDWFTWERRGFIEEIIIQVYRNDLPRFVAELEREEVKLAKGHIPVGIGILTGLKNNSIPLKQIQDQVQEVRKRGLAGVSFFFYESLSSWAKETPEQRNSAFRQMFPTKMQRPSV
ncbi:glycoside hydrolase family 10 protein [Kamptonema sp. UHCC 0994]|uniref:glycoside hydrolase family 10 protein n=1 Tax=Kamptonema sp. UHCC 0994 TaxID=3031329 RepID=UPI0023B9CB7C|nr:glycoside hydrolase family 10 protein [Kamptonema sp. UHCC 0994]MDF0551679.1 glycoside hydrolase family 10 protein [Kamptonema sp. UHCC 0994]